MRVKFKGRGADFRFRGGPGGLALAIEASQLREPQGGPITFISKGMKRAAVLSALVALVGLALGLSPALAGSRARGRIVVVELFTAEGCVSCDKASGPLSDLADTPGVVALTFPVDYWDYLGWPDRYARPAFTERQKAYERHFGLRDVYTPQVVIDGAAQLSGDDGPGLKAMTAKSRHNLDHGPDIKIRRDGQLKVGVGRPLRGGAEVWLIRYDPKAHEIQVKAGDNHGAKVSERNVVRQMVRLGSWTGRSSLFKFPAPEVEGLRTLIIVQGQHGGRMLSARLLPGPRS